MPAHQNRQPDTLQSDPGKDATNSSGEDEGLSASSDQAVQLAQALRFLQDESLRDASTESKLAFLSSKGLDEATLEKAQEQIQASSTRSASSQVPGQNDSQTWQTPHQPSTSSASPAPPIITYPEFLLHSQKPPPLVTASRIFSAAYAVTGAATLLYGVSQYLVKPMTNSLTAARHDFATHTKHQVDELNNRLLSTVSRDPTKDNAYAYNDIDHQKSSGVEPFHDEYSATDPTELFHRDFGTQTTTPPPSPPHSSSSSSSFTDHPARSLEAAAQLSRLRTLASSLSSDHLSSESDSAQSISTVVRILNDYLESMTFPSYSSSVDITNDVVVVVVVVDMGMGLMECRGRGKRWMS